jgi:hypothetical protein
MLDDPFYGNVSTLMPSLGTWGASFPSSLVAPDLALFKISPYTVRSLRCNIIEVDVAAVNATVLALKTNEFACLFLMCISCEHLARTMLCQSMRCKRVCVYMFAIACVFS